MEQVPLADTETRAFAARHWFWYCLPSQPHTGETTSGHDVGTSWQKPTAWAERQTPTAVEQYLLLPQSAVVAHVDWQPPATKGVPANAATIDRAAAAPNHWARLSMAHLVSHHVARL